MVLNYFVFLVVTQVNTTLIESSNEAQQLHEVAKGLTKNITATTSKNAKVI